MNLPPIDVPDSALSNDESLKSRSHSVLEIFVQKFSPSISGFDNSYCDDKCITSLSTREKYSRVLLFEYLKFSDVLSQLLAQTVSMLASFSDHNNPASTALKAKSKCRK